MQFLLQGHERTAGIVQNLPDEAGKKQEVIAGALLVVFPDVVVDGVERIKDEVRFQLRIECMAECK